MTEFEKIILYSTCGFVIGHDIFGPLIVWLLK
jgi:hypothetical protein